MSEHRVTIRRPRGKWVGSCTCGFGCTSWFWLTTHEDCGCWRGTYAMALEHVGLFAPPDCPADANG